MARYYTPLLTGGPLTANNFNQRLQELDDAIQQSLEWRAFNVKAYPYNAAGTGIGDDLDSFENAIADAADWAVSPSRGGVVEIPAGRYPFSAPYTPPALIQNVALIGVDVQGSTPIQKPSMIVGTDNSVPVFDFGSDLANHFKLKNLGISGAGGTNLGHQGIFSEGISNLWVENVFITGFGGNAIKLGTSADVASAGAFKDLFITGCMQGHAALADYAGVVEIHGNENFFWIANVNGPGGDFAVEVNDGGDDHLGETGGGVVGSGFLCSLLGDGNLFHVYFGTYAFSHYGAKFTSGLGNDIAHCRFEFNQRNGLWTDGIKGRYTANRLQDNSQEADGTYAHVRIGDGGIKGYDNVWNGNGFHSVNYDYAPNYAYDIRAGGGTGWVLRNEITGNIGNGFNLAYITKSGAAPIVLPDDNYRQSYSISTDAQTVTFNSQEGRKWRVHLTSAALNVTIAAPLYPIEGMGATLEIFNQTGSPLTSVTFNAVFKVATLTLPATGKRRTTQIEFDGTSWIQSGDWSGDL